MFRYAASYSFKTNFAEEEEEGGGGGDSMMLIMMMKLCFCNSIH
jgi:hypothetical protein